MTGPGILRRWKLPMARVITALFAVGWLGLALQPCQALAHGSAATDSAQRSHHAMQDDAGDPCPHCPSQQSGDCGSGSALACEAVAVPAPPIKDFTPPVSPDQWLAPPRVVGSARFVRAVLVPPDPGRTRLPACSLQQRFCTYQK